MTPVYRYLALGDSYTVGEAVDPAFSFPRQLADRLAGRATVVPTIIARTGWTTGELLEHLGEEPVAGLFDLVTLLIGVNNQYRQYDPETFRPEFTALLGQAIEFAGGRKDRVIVISIPDWGVTPFASGDRRSALEIGTMIDRYNAMSRAITLEAGVRYLSITEGSRQAAFDPELTAADGLHPSGKMYSHWADRLSVIVEELL